MCIANYLALFLLNYLAITNAEISHRIVGGANALEGMYPYQAYLIDEKGFLCGASVINKRYLLTAAHCLVNVYPTLLKAIVGTNNISDASGQTYSVESFVIHENYHRPGGIHGVNDIAVVRVKKDIVFSDKVQPVKLPDKSISIADNTTVTLSGLGKLKYLGKYPKTLQHVQLSILNQEICNFEWLKLKLITIEESMLCTAGKPGVGACNGDSGSPLALNGTQIGISSFGHFCAFGYPDVYTRISTYIDWIDKFLN